MWEIFEGFCGLTEEPPNLRDSFASDSPSERLLSKIGQKGVLISNTASSVVNPINILEGISLWQLSEHNLKTKPPLCPKETYMPWSDRQVGNR